ncbi:hypothetical protein FXO38_31333 [Capsicum annuum]|nr:hypothetical protein FXO38_31333 [Capsicum annuum]
MATTFGGSNPPEGSRTQITEGEINHKENAPKYADLLKPKIHVHENVRITPKPMVMMHGEPRITWKVSEVQSMVIQENLQYAIVGKFSYGKPVVNELRKMIPNQCGIKGDCMIGVLDERNILIKLNQLLDYVKLLSTIAYYIKANGRLW